MPDHSTLAAQIFPFKPAEVDEGASRYVQSYGYYRFRMMMPEFASLLSQRHAETDLRNEVEHCQRLGPYERQVLGQVLHAEPGLVLIVGTAGSGKSSTLRYVLNFFDEHQRPSPPRQGLGRFMQELQVSQFKHVFVDLNGIVDEMQNLAARLTPEQVEDRLLLELPPAFQAAILESIAPAAHAQQKTAKDLLMQVIDLVRDWSEEPTHCPPPFKAHRAQMLSVLPHLDPLATGSFHKLTTALAKLEGRKQLQFWFSILEALTQMISRPSGRSLVLIDNVDPLSQHLQSYLKGQLIDLVQNVTFKVVLPMRLSTFTQGKTNYARIVTWYPHSGPGPVDVITTRILSFLATPEEYSAYRALTPADQQRALFKVFELLLRLHRGGGEYRALGRVLTAAAGDSIRRAMQMMEHLIAHENPREPNAIERIAERIGEVRRRYELRLLLERLGTALFEELTAIAEEDPLLSGQKLPLWSERISARLSLTISAVLENAVQHKQSRLSELETADLERICATEIAGTTCRSEVQAGWGLVVENARERGVADHDIAEALDRLERDLRARTSELLDATLGGPDVSGTAVWQLISAGLRETSDASADTPRDGSTDDEDILSRTFDWDTSRLCRDVLYANGPHRAVRALVTSRFVVDLLHDGAQNNIVSSGKMRVLIMLAANPRGQTELSELIECLSNHGHTKPSILHFINDLVIENVRAIWINKSFAYRDFQELERDRGHRVQLTRGGWGMLTVGAGELNYLTSVFPPSTRGVRKVGRLQCALDELRAIHYKDMRIYTDWAKTKAPPLPPGLSGDAFNGAAPTVAARAAEELIWNCRGHFRRVQRGERGAHHDRLSELEATREVLRRWHAFLDEAWQDLKRMAPADRREERAAVPSSFRFNRALDPSHRRAVPCAGLPAIERAREVLSAALRRDDFWTQEMSADEFRA